MTPQAIVSSFPVTTHYQPQRGQLAQTKPALDSRALLAGHACIAIHHGKDVYWLRSTRQGKLLLTK